MVNYEKIKDWYIKKESELKGIRQSGYLMYFYDVKNFETVTLESLDVIYTHEQTKELFLLDTPTFYEKGQPVFVVLRGFPISVQFEFKTRKLINQSLIELEKALQETEIGKIDANSDKIIQALSKRNKAIDSMDKDVIAIEPECSSYDLMSKLDSVYIDKIFSKKKLDKKYYVITFAMFLLGCAMSWMLCKIYLPVKIITEYIIIGG